MTTDGRQQNRALPLGRIAGAIALVVFGWLAVVVAALATIARANGRILASNDFVTIARSDDADFVVRLYAAGALLVLDAEQAGGCSGLPPNSSLRAKRSNPSLG